jgi:hypothetical protein
LHTRYSRSSVSLTRQQIGEMAYTCRLCQDRSYGVS